MKREVVRSSEVCHSFEKVGFFFWMPESIASSTSFVCTALAFQTLTYLSPVEQHNQSPSIKRKTRHTHHQRPSDP